MLGVEKVIVSAATTVSRRSGGRSMPLSYRNASSRWKWET